MKKLTFGLRNILIFSFILLGGLPILVMGFIAIKFISADIDMEVRAKNLLIARSFSSEVQTFLDEALSTLRLIEDAIIKKQYIRRDDVNNYLNDTLMVHFEFDSVAILDEKGIVRFAAPYDRDFIGMNLSGQTFFSRVRQYGQPYWSSTFISLQTGKPTLMLAVPMKGGIIVGYLNLATLSLATGRRIQTGRMIHSLIIDREGTIIAHPDQNKVSERQNMGYLEFLRQENRRHEGDFIYREDGREYLASLSPVPYTQWTVIVVVPVDEAFAPVARVRKLFAIGASLAILLATAIAFITLRKVTNPLSQLVRGARRIAQGSYVPENIPSSYKEMDELIYDFHLMTLAIQSREKELKESKETLQVFFDAVHESMVIINAEGIVLLSNATGAVRLGKTVQELVGACLYDHFPPDLSVNRKEQYEKVIATGEPVFFEDTRAGRYFGQYCYPVFGGDGKAAEVAIFGQEITERKKAEDAIHAMAQRYHTILSHQHYGILVVAEDNKIEYVNQIFCDQLGPSWTPSELIGLTAEEIIRIVLHACTDPAAMSAFIRESVAEGRLVLGKEVVMRNGRIYLVDFTQILIDGKRSGRMWLYRDITERKLAEDQIRASLKEKEILLKEVHHRVKNNLAIIASILALQSRHVQDETSLEIFRECENRVRTMAMIHTKLYQSKDLAHVDFTSYIQELANDLFVSYRVNSDAVAIKVDIEDISLDINVAIPVGLILNELLSNTLKYAFPVEENRTGDEKTGAGEGETGSKGEIVVIMREERIGELPSPLAGEGRGEGEDSMLHALRYTLITLSISDNGIGFPDDIDFRNTKSLGLQLVMALVEQLEGTIEIKRNGGTIFIVKFKEER